MPRVARSDRVALRITPMLIPGYSSSGTKRFFAELRLGHAYTIAGVSHVNFILRGTVERCVNIYIPVESLPKISLFFVNAQSRS